MAAKNTSKSPTAKTDLKAAATRVKNAAKKTAGVAKKTSAKSPSAKTDLKAAATRVSNAQEKLVDSAETEINARFRDAQKAARQVWFAGLGAYGRLFDEAQTRYSRLQKERNELFKDLIARGEKVQDDAEALLKEGRANVEDQIETAKDRFAGVTSKVGIPARLQDLSDRLESLSANLKKSA